MQRWNAYWSVHIWCVLISLICETKIKLIFATPELIDTATEFKNVPLADAVSSRLSPILGSKGKCKYHAHISQSYAHKFGVITRLTRLN